MGVPAKPNCREKPRSQKRDPGHPPPTHPPGNRPYDPTLCLALTISHTVPRSGESNKKRMYHGSAVLGHPSVRYVGYSQ
jgi:hypothetical protein